MLQTTRSYCKHRRETSNYSTTTSDLLAASLPHDHASSNSSRHTTKILAQLLKPPSESPLLRPLLWTLFPFQSTTRHLLRTLLQSPSSENLLLQEPFLEACVSYDPLGVHPTSANFGPPSTPELPKSAILSQTFPRRILCISREWPWHCQKECWTKMVQTTILVKMTFFQTGF